MLSDQFFYLPIFREPVQGPFREDQATIQGDLEHTAPAGNKLYTNTVKLAFQFCFQTGSPRQVVSDRAVFDRYFHGLSCIDDHFIK